MLNGIRWRNYNENNILIENIEGNNEYFVRNIRIEEYIL